LLPSLSVSFQTFFLVIIRQINLNVCFERYDKEKVSYIHQNKLRFVALLQLKETDILNDLLDRLSFFCPWGSIPSHLKQTKVYTNTNFLFTL
jgi:hypothetical protein